MTRNSLSREECKTFLISALGGSLEFYDFVVYVFFAQIISQLFFNASSHVGGLLLSFTVFASGYLARIFGGWLFSHFGDLNGRKKSFAITIFLMAAPTFIIGILPTYSQIGIMATILLVSCRIAQGLAVGGEIPCSITFIYEHAQKAHRGFACGILFCGIILGIFLGSLVGAIMTRSLSQDALYQWGWRLPFLVGGVLGLVGVYLRKYLNETPLFTQIKKERIKIPLVTVLKEHKLNLFRTTVVVWSFAVAVTLFLLYMPTYFHFYFQFPADQVLILNSIAVFLYAFLIIGFGFLVDRIGYKIILNSGLMLFIFTTYPLFSLFEAGNYTALYLCYGTVIIANAALTSAGVYLLAQSYPTEVRYSGSSLSYNLAFGLFGGFTPLIATELIKVTGSTSSPAFYMIGVCVFAFMLVNLKWCGGGDSNS